MPMPEQEELTLIFAFFLYFLVWVLSPPLIIWLVLQPVTFWEYFAAIWLCLFAAILGFVAGLFVLGVLVGD